MASTVDQLTGMVPIVVAGGIALKFTDEALGRSGYSRNGKRGRYGKKGRKSRRSSVGFGDFRNVGIY